MGPPAAATSIAKGKRPKDPTLGALANWLDVLRNQKPSLKGAGKGHNDLLGIFEAGLQALRAEIEGGREPDETETRELGQLSGEWLLKLESQTDRRQEYLRKMRTILRSVRDASWLSHDVSTAVDIADLFGLIETALQAAVPPTP